MRLLADDPALAHGPPARPSQCHCARADRLGREGRAGLDGAVPPALSLANVPNSGLHSLREIALQRGDRALLECHRWFGEAWERIFKDQPAVRLDG